MVGLASTAMRWPTRRPHLSATQRSIVQVLSARGGRLWMIDLVFELRRGGATADHITDALDALVELELVAGPSRHQCYELTAAGRHFLEDPPVAPRRTEPTSRPRPRR